MAEPNEAELISIEEKVSEDDKAVVESDLKGIRAFVSGLSADDIKSGDWFARLLAVSLPLYAKKVDAAYFKEKYKGLPADAIVARRITLATRYAAIEGGLSSGAYTIAVASTIGSLGGASPITVPAAVTSMMVDIAYTTQLQLQLAYDVSVLYGLPIDVEDPEDLWKLIRVAFMVKGGELVREGGMKAVPALVRPLIKRFISGRTLAAARSLPVVGQHLLQRNIIKIGIPLVGVPLAVVLNRWTTKVAGEHAKKVFRAEAQTIEITQQVMEDVDDAGLALWTGWFTICDGKISERESLFMSCLTKVARDQHGVVDNELEQVIDLTATRFWRRVDQAVDAGTGLAVLTDVAIAAAEIDGGMTRHEKQVVRELRRRTEAV